MVYLMLYDKEMKIIFEIGELDDFIFIVRVNCSFVVVKKIIWNELKCL